MAIDLNILKGDTLKKAEELSKDIEFRSISEKGANGYVLFGHNRVLKRDVVVKFYYWGSGDHAEPELLAKLESDYILKVYHAESLNKDDAYFMTPHCASGDLLDAINKRRFGNVEAIDIIGQIAAGTSFLHGNGYLHRDLKPENLFCVSESKFVIGDFGSVVPQHEDGSANSRTRHSLIYRTPEEITQRKYYRQGDVYQLGMVLYQVLGGSLSYNERDWLTKKEQAVYDGLSGYDQQLFATEAIEKLIIKGRILDLGSLPPWVCKPLRTMIRKCCSTDVGTRYALVADLSSALNNLRGRVPDWRVEEHPILRRGRKQFRVVPYKGALAIEKKAGENWRRERALNPANLTEAVEMAEAI